MRPKLRVFLDTSAIFVGIWSPSGGGRMILKLGEAGMLLLLTNAEVLGEFDRVLKRKAPESLGDLALVLDRSRLEIVPSPTQRIVDRCLELIDHMGDARIFVPAWSAEVDYFVTFDRAHLLQNKLLQEEVPFPIGTPGDFLDWFRGELI
ncbi:MAG: PIN domain-containing protein [Anaerolineales bacterium]|nr:PIN domain-containing protein [Anaerolineales bacterium]